MVSNILRLIPEFSKCSFYDFQVVYYSLNSLQGLLDALVFGITNTQLREHYKGRVVRAIIIFILSPILIFPAFVMFVIKQFWKPKEANVQGNHEKSLLF